MKLLKLIANLGYGSRKEVTAYFQRGRITDIHGAVLEPDSDVRWEEVRFAGEPLDPPAPFTLLLNKPVGYTCSTTDPGPVVYDLLPPRFRLRSPKLATVGRLDKDTTGMLLMTDDGALLHKIVHPKTHVPKVYEAILARELSGDEVQLFASGTLMLESEKDPLAPATLEVLDARHARLTLTEGRYHQARRMFAAAGNHVLALHRSRMGGLTLGELPSGQWRPLSADDLGQLFAGA